MCSTILKFYPGWTQEESHLSAPDVTRHSKSEVFWKHTLVEHRRKAICLHLMWQGINNPRGIEKTHYIGEHMRNAICLHYMWQGIQIQGVLKKHTGRTQEESYLSAPNVTFKTRGVLTKHTGWTQEESHLAAEYVTRHSKSEVFWKHNRKPICLHLMWQGINNPRSIEKTY